MKYFLLVFSIIFTVSFTDLLPQDYKQYKPSNSLGKPSATYLNINNISTYFFNNGISDNDLSGNSGFFFPKGSGKTAVFQSGFLWGAKISGDPQVRVGGSSYRSGLKGGKIISHGIAENSTADHVRIYRVRRDVYPGGPYVDLSGESRNEFQLTEENSNYTSHGYKTIEEIRNQYEKDWTEWRAVDGAPFEDQNGNGIYEPAIDIPGFPGADQTIWYVTNDLDTATTKYIYGTLPLGIELQVTIWAYSTDDYLNDLLFRKYVMINKSSTTFNDAYITMWSDTEIGDASNDYVGCDTTLDLGFGYNAFAEDATYFPSPPAAVGFKLLKGPSISANYTLPMTAFYPVYKSTEAGDPVQGEVDGAIRFYNFMKGKYGLLEKPFISPLTGDTSTFPLSGDPVTNQGWLDGLIYPTGLPPGDRRCGIASGPFQMAAGDTQTIIFAEIAAMGTDRLNSVELLKESALLVEDFYKNGLIHLVQPKVPDPHVLLKGTLGKIRLNWDEDVLQNDFIENFNFQGHKFQGYNIYQLPSISSRKKGAEKIATYDIADGITNISQSYIDPISGLEIDSTYQNGTDSGIKRYFNTDFDYIENSRMLIGKEYYFAVTAYTYNDEFSSPKKSYESPIKIISAKYCDNYPGPTYGDYIPSTNTENLDGSQIKVTVEDPTKLTGDTYEVFFTERDEIKNEQGDWIAASAINKINDLNELTGSSISITANYDDNPVKGVKLTFTLNLDSSSHSFAEGIKITIPSFISIISVPEFFANGFVFEPRMLGQEMLVGYTAGEQTKKKLFRGGETWSIFVDNFRPPANFNWQIFDDGSSDTDSLYSSVEGITLIENIGSKSMRRAKYWNVKDVTKNTLVLENQSIVNGKNLYPDRDDLDQHINYFPSPVVDGVRINANINYEVPLGISSLKINASSTTNINDDEIVINDYYYYSSKAIDNFSIGTSDLKILEQDYELIFTGNFGYKTINNLEYEYVVDGGSLATFVGGSKDSSAAKHPLNPNPESNEPFLVRIPFEVWNKDKGMQVNIIIKDNYSDINSVWDSYNGSKYGIIVNSPYNDTVPITLSQADTNNSQATWALRFSHTIYHINDTVTIIYSNPIQFGVDKFTFTTPKPIHEITDIELESYLIYQNYPNPFNPATKIRFYIPEAGNVKVEVFNILGQSVTRLLDGDFQSGLYEINFDGSNLASGIYIYTIEVKNKFFKAKKMLLLK